MAKHICPRCAQEFVDDDGGKWRTDPDTGATTGNQYPHNAEDQGSPNPSALLLAQSRLLEDCENIMAFEEQANKAGKMPFSAFNCCPRIPESRTLV
jgi:hypothetical protein